MVNKIRLQLAIWFVLMVMLLYAAGGAASLFVFRSSLTRSIDMGLEDQIAEIRPSIEVDENGRPSLESWSRQALEQRELPLPATVQLFDSDKQPVKQFGPKGFPELRNGSLTKDGESGPISLRSMNTRIERNGKPIGFLQIQVSTDIQDEAVEQFGMAVVVIAPLVAIGVGLCAYLFSGKAVRPIERTMVLLRRFVADAGHELKTPVATMEACLETLEADKETSGISATMLEMMHRASGRLRHLSKDLIVLAMIEDPESELIRKRIDLKEVAYTVAEELSTAASAKNINLSVGPFPEIYVEAHEESLHEIFNNLIDNAIKYSRENGEVVVAATTKGDHVAISVTDCGIGIPHNCIEQVFDRFYRVDDSRTSKIGGSGLGLSIVKAAVERHKGAVSIDSEIDKGTTFTVTLPILRQSQPRTT